MGKEESEANCLATEQAQKLAVEYLRVGVKPYMPWVVKQERDGGGGRLARVRAAAGQTSKLRWGIHKDIGGGETEPAEWHLCHCLTNYYDVLVPVP